MGPQKGREQEEVLVEEITNRLESNREEEDTERTEA
jgi:hypothetical protein